jgi:hypothetical protein
VKLLLATFGLLALGTIATRGAAVAIMLAFAAGGGFLAGTVTRNVWKGGQG